MARDGSLVAGLVAMFGLAFAQPAVASPEPRATPARMAQVVVPTEATEPLVSPESFEIGLSTDTIVITSGFNGARLVVFGALDDADDRIRRQGGYDIVVVLEGPKTPIVVRQKERVLGLWINRGAESFETAPASYALASTRRLTDIAPVSVLENLSVGIDNLRVGMGNPASAGRPNRDEYATALRRIRVERGLYNETFGTVEFVGPTLFRAELALSADLPVGRHQARGFLFRNGVFVRERSGPLWVVKSGFENSVSNLAERSGVVYGILAVALAIVTGWFGRVIFKRD